MKWVMCWYDYLEYLKVLDTLYFLFRKSRYATMFVATELFPDIGRKK